MTRLAAALTLGVCVLLCGTLTTAQEKKEEKKDKDAPKMGKLIGILVAKDKNFIEVKADGEEKARRYTPQWVGGAPAKGGGFDKKTLKTFSELKIGSRIEVEWLFEERLRAINIKVLKAPPTEDKK